MSKQVKLKFKKLLKKAEFVHADLEYHEELLPDAKQEFFAAAQKVLDALPEADQQKIHELRERKMLQKQKSIENAAKKKEEEESCDTEEEKSSSELLITEEFPEGIELNPDIERGEVPAIKESEIKKMFRAIASVTHPDKLGKNLPGAQKSRLDKIFKKAKDAYTNGNWYVLYSISLDMALSVPEPTKEHIEWLESDIKFTAGQVSHMGTLLVWVWYTGGEDSKKYALQNYFQQVYDYDLPLET
tara:strand:+ start:114 stop:845 length:732 start_codon:yes stop_codon:yes gene_type:complete